jgi:hypothetical protein
MCPAHPRPRLHPWSRRLWAVAAPWPQRLSPRPHRLPRGHPAAASNATEPATVPAGACPCVAISHTDQAAWTTVTSQCGTYGAGSWASELPLCRRAQGVTLEFTTIERDKGCSQAPSHPPGCPAIGAPASPVRHRRYVPGFSGLAGGMLRLAEPLPHRLRLGHQRCQLRCSEPGGTGARPRAPDHRGLPRHC